MTVFTSAADINNARNASPARASERANEGEGHESKINNYIDNLYFTRDPVT